MTERDGIQEFDQSAQYVLQTLDDTGQPMKISELVGSYWADRVAAPKYGHPAHLAQGERGAAVSDDLSYARKEVEGAVRVLADLDRVQLENITLEGENVLKDETYVLLPDHQDADVIEEVLDADDDRLVSAATPLRSHEGKPLSQDEKIMGDQINTQIYDEERTRARREREEITRDRPVLTQEELEE